MISFQFYKRCNSFISKHIFRLLYSRSFKVFGKRVFISKPDIIEGAHFISLNDNVSIGTSCWLLALKNSDLAPSILVKEGACIGRFVHIVAVKSLIIEKNVLIADKVYISDNIHEYQNIGLPIMQQPIAFKGEVSIGENSWVGENVSIIGASIGKHCVIGANSVVTSDIPDYCIAVGSPAKVIKRYDSELNSWRKV